MAEKLNEKELVSFKEMLVANSIQVDAVAQLLIEKGVSRGKSPRMNSFQSLNRCKPITKARTVNPFERNHLCQQSIPLEGHTEKLNSLIQVTYKQVQPYISLESPVYIFPVLSSDPRSFQWKK